MAIRVQTRFPFHLIISNFQKIPPYSLHKLSSFSRTLNPPSKFEVPENSQFRQRVSLANLLQRYGVPSSNLNGFLRENQFLLNFSLSDVEKSLGILLSFKLSQKSLVSILFSCPRVLELGFLKKWEMGFSTLGFSAASPMAIQRVLEQSQRFRIEPADLYKNLEVMKDLGFSDETVTRVLEEFPRVIMMSVRDLNLRIEFFKGSGLKGYEIDRVCYSFPGILGFSVENRLRHLFEEFEDLGFSKNEVRKAVIENPRLLSLEVGELSKCVELLRTLKCRLPIKEKILHRGLFRAGIEVKLRVDCLCRHGLIRREAFIVLRREPRSIIYELEDVEKKIEFLLHRIGLNIGCLVEVPEYLGVNLEKQIIPRYNVIEYLRSKGGLGFEVGLKGLVRPSTLRFYNLFVKPYPECEKIFGRLPRDVEVRTRHPVGLWKLFKPQQFPKSKEDMRNIKLFMESLV
ncbi:mitochondrial transcription termination factor family protein [Tasmannia lanceolata]|uniref:mitochondrial transcription termination factor family protein n=1 Tax=Tasmannia lanceolata TaxID=3420 RepID=UPI00406351ED